MSDDAPPADAQKRACAFAAVDSLEAREGGVRLGLGSGSTVVFVAERLAQRHADEADAFRLAACVPTSFQARQLVLDGGLPLGDLERFPELDVAVDGADELVDAPGATRLCLIKGGGGCQTGEKMVASCARRFVVVADGSKPSAALGTRWRKGVPVSVLPDARVPVSRRLAALGAARVDLRMAKSKAGPVVDDYGCLILDADFGQIADPDALGAAIDRVPGVVCHGLFTGAVAGTEAFVGMPDGSVRRIQREEA